MFNSHDISINKPSCKSEEFICLILSTCFNIFSPSLVVCRCWKEKATDNKPCNKYLYYLQVFCPSNSINCHANFFFPVLLCNISRPFFIRDNILPSCHQPKARNSNDRSILLLLFIGIRTLKCVILYTNSTHFNCDKQPGMH